MTHVKMNRIDWEDWMQFRDAQKEIVLAAGSVAHIGVTIRYIDIGTPSEGLCCSCTAFRPGDTCIMR